MLIFFHESGDSKSVSYYLSDPSLVYTYQAKRDASEIYKLGMRFYLNFADNWKVNNQMLKKINKNSGHENTFIIRTSLVF